MSQFSDLYVLMDLGFDTGALRWFLQFRDKKYRVISSMMASKIIITNGSGSQFGWIDDNMQIPGYFWHVRERYYTDDVEELRQAGDVIHLSMKRKYPSIAGMKGLMPDEIKDEDVRLFDYAYRLKDAQAGQGFIELKREDESIIDVIKGKQIITENLNHETVGEYPRIRLRANAKDVKEIVITNSAVVLVGI